MASEQAPHRPNLKMSISFSPDVNEKAYEDFVKAIFLFLEKNNLLINDNEQHVFAIQLKMDGHHILLQNQLENKDAKNIELFDESLQVDIKKTVVFSYDRGHITMNFSENLKDKTEGTEKYVNLKSKSFVFDRKSFNLLEITTNSLNNLMNLMMKENNIRVTALDEHTSSVNKIRLKLMTHDKNQSNLQIAQMRGTYHHNEMFFYKKGKNQENHRVESLGTRFTCTLNDILENENVKSIPPRNLSSIFREIISQLKERGFPHGDLKAKNFLLREDDKNNSIYLKIIDAENAKIDGCLRGGHNLKDKLSIRHIAMDLGFLSVLADK
jgi:hypothetical protein